jgi:hypothetical protein
METSGQNANKEVGYRSTMRICGAFEQLRGEEQRPQAHRLARERVETPLFAVDDRDRCRDAEALGAQRLDGL